MIRTKTKRRPALLLLVALLLAFIALPGTAPAVAQPAGAYDLPWHTMDGGGHTFSTGGRYSLGGTMGQPDAGLLKGGRYTLAGGFWPGWAQAAKYIIYLPLVLRTY
jgi:hypothetical protein